MARREERMLSSIRLCPLSSKATGEGGGSRPKAAPLRENSSEVRMRGTGDSTGCCGTSSAIERRKEGKEGWQQQVLHNFQYRVS